jgi:hypothetical protein
VAFEIIKNVGVRTFTGLRIKKFEHVSKRSYETQNSLLLQLLATSRGTQIYQDLGLKDVKNLHEFAQRVEPRGYDFYKPYVENVMQGQPRVLFHDPLQFVAVTSGTTSTEMMTFNGRRIPFNKAMIDLFKSFMLVSFSRLVSLLGDVDLKNDSWFNYGTYTEPSLKDQLKVPEGYLSGYLVASDKKSSFVSMLKRFPSDETLKIGDWPTKVERILDECEKQRSIRVASGIPSYLMHIFERALQRNPGKTLTDIWPRLEVIHYSGTPIEKFRKRFDDMAGRKLKYCGSYIASEGAFGVFADFGVPLVHLNLEAVVFCFVENSDPSGRVLTIDQLKSGGEYRVLVTLPNGFFQYELGDVLKVSTMSPIPTFSVVGRNNAAMNIAAEKVTEDYANLTVFQTQAALDIGIAHYFLFPSQNEEGKDVYQWGIILDNDYPHVKPHEIATHLDNRLMDLSGDYKDCRMKDKVIDFPKVTLLPREIERDYFNKFHARGQLKMKQFFQSKDEFVKLLQKVSPDVCSRLEI